MRQKPSFDRVDTCGLWESALHRGMSGDTLIERHASTRVLLVEDDYLIRTSLADGLREDGFEVLEVDNGDEAIRLLEAPVDFDLLCTDVRMPGSADGIDVALRARDQRPDLPVVIVSGYATQLSRRLHAFDPPAAFVPKPFTPTQISRVLRNLLASE